MTSNTTESGHLTTSRASRLLRPLRNKCNSLAELSKTAAASRVTYSKQSSNWNSDGRPPLAVLYPSAGIKKLTLDRRSADEFELSRRIHAVCGAFKNIAHVAFGQPFCERVPSLAAMCTLVVGGNMPSTNTDNMADPGEDSADILDVDGVYEIVPSHYRRFLIVPHALSMILTICAHHHTLVTILLDHCLSFGLVHESTRLLNIILAQAFLPSNSTCPPPVMHPGHANYLLDLHTKWTAGNRLSSSDALLFTTSAFCQAVLDTLSRSSSCNLHSLWTSKVLNRLLHAVESCDIDSYIFIIHALSRNFSETSGSSPDAIRDDEQAGILRDKLSELMSNLFDLLFTQHHSYHPPSTPSRIHATIDVLFECRAAGLHRLRMSTSGPPTDLSDMIISFTTHIFVTFRNLVNNFDRLLVILDDSSPSPTAFSKLMVYFTRVQGDQAFGDSAEAFLSRLQLYSSALRSEKLFRLDASLWACALHHFETLATSQKGSSALVIRYKRQLMEAVDTAERLCFGGDIQSSPVVSSSIRPARARPTHHTRTSGHWEWEDMVDCWIRQTPVYKKRRIDSGRPHSPLRHNDSRPRDTITSKVVTSTSVSTPLSTHHEPLSTLSSSSPYSQFSESESPTEDGSEYQEESDKENHPSTPTKMDKRSHRVKRRSSNFISLLADAQMNRIVLHSRPHPKPRPPSTTVIPERYVPPLSSQGPRRVPRKQERKTCYRKALPPPAAPSGSIPEKYVLPLSSQEPRRAPRKRERDTYDRKASPLATPSGSMPPSDDLLNLFAFATPSPGRC